MVRRSKYMIRIYILLINSLESFKVNAVSPIGPCTINSGIAGLPQIQLPNLPGTNPRLKCTDKGVINL